MLLRNAIKIGRQFIRERNTPGVRLEAFIVTQDLTGGCSRHRCNEKRVSQTSSSNLLLQASPVPKISRSNTPHVVLQLALLSRTSHPGLIRTFSLSKLRAGFKSSVVNSLKDLDVEFLCCKRVERHTKCHEGISETLYTDTDGTMAHVGTTSFGNRIVINVDDLVEIISNDFGNIVEFLEVILTVDDETRESERGEIADGGLFWRRVLDDFRAQVGRLDSS